MIVVSIPAAEPEATARSPEKAHTVFLVEVLCNGRRHTVAKRYSEFQALHKRIKKTCKVPDFPPRRVPNWVPKVLEQRRQGLELYIQGGSRALQGLRFFSHCSTSHPPSQRPVLGFHTDPYVRLPVTDALPDTVLSGVLQGLYAPWSCCPRAAVSQGQPGS
ncbi:sorting nexin-22 isoform X2 [Cygnus olor]|uniref:sorting nexin-22 isoform X2 n=1 Tax=Cygnus olor TaxID=8869 RepID=UPI001ADE72CF|nr:sorting nexin-22 isoform X2 [Cygnus olor]